MRSGEHEATAVPARDAYARIAASYDSSPNPMLSLERRYLENLLPTVRNRDVVDLGCGTGRWLREFEAQNSKSLTGIDLSPEMLAEAERTVASAMLILSDACNSPLREGTADLILGSFLLGYISDLRLFAREVRRLLRPGGYAFFSDVHPRTAAQLGWNRTFATSCGKVTPTSFHHDLSFVTAAFREVGFDLVCRLEPAFGEPEETIFDSAGRNDFQQAAASPAIYLLGFKLHSNEFTNAYCLQADRIALGAATSIPANLVIAGDRLEQIASPDYLSHSSSAIDLSGHLLLPGLINAHDHLEFALFPRLGRGAYNNAGEWAVDIHANFAITIKRHRAVPRETRLWWGALRNVLAGVTTVCHHNPYDDEVFTRHFPIEVVKSFSWAHSFGFDEVATKHAESAADEPFIVHLSEGVDELSAVEFQAFARLGLLDSRSVIVHGLALSYADISALNAARASLVWCPSSNQYLFGRTLNRGQLRRLDRIALGSDSSLTAEGDFLDELRVAGNHSDYTPAQLYSLVTSTPAGILQLTEGQGRIRLGGVADFIAVQDKFSTPAEALTQLSVEQIELVISRGRVVLASPAMLERLPHVHKQQLFPVEIEGLIRFVRAPVGQLFRDAVAHLGCELRLGGKRVGHVSTEWL